MLKPPICNSTNEWTISFNASSKKIRGKVGHIPNIWGQGYLKILIYVYYRVRLKVRKIRISKPFLKAIFEPLVLLILEKVSCEVWNHFSEIVRFGGGPRRVQLASVLRYVKSESRSLKAGILLVKFQSVEYLLATLRFVCLRERINNAEWPFSKSLTL